MSNFEKDIDWDKFEKYLRTEVFKPVPTLEWEIAKYKEWLRYIYDHLGIEPFNANPNELLPGNTQAPLYTKLANILKQKYEYNISAPISALRSYLKFKHPYMPVNPGEQTFEK